MNSDIRISTAFFAHRKTRRLEMTLGAEGVLALIKLWVNVATLKPNGELKNWDAVDIALTAEYKGDHSEFVDTLTKLGLLDMENETYSIHDWAEHQPWAVNADIRSLNGAKNQALRWCLKKIPTQKGKGKFKEWYQSYPFVKGDNADGIVSVYESYSKPLTPSPTPPPSPSPSPSPKDIDIGKFEKFRPEWISLELWNEIIVSRISKKLQNTALALKTFTNSLKKGVDAGYSIETCVGEYVAANWERFDHSWIKKGDDNGNGNSKQRGTGFVEAGRNRDWLGESAMRQT